MAEAAQLPDGPSAAAAPRDDEAAAALESFLGDELKAKVQDWCATETAELSGELVQFLVVADGVRRTVSIQGPRCYGRPAPALSASRSATLSSTRSSRLAGCVCVAALAAPL